MIEDKAMVEFKNQDVVVNRSQVPLVTACKQQGIPLRSVFAKVISDGTYVKVSYPLVTLDSDGDIPINEDGNIIANKYIVYKMAKLATGNHEYKAVQHHIDDAKDGIIS